MRVRLVPIGEIFRRMPFVVRDLARESGKKVTLLLHGQSTEIDKYLIERMMDPVLHLVRNAVSHGIEDPDKILIRDPLASGTMRAIFGMILLRSLAETGSAAGFAWLARLDAQTREYVVNATLLLEKLGRREGLVTLWDLPDVLLEQQRGLPITSVFPPSGTPVIDDAVGLVAGAKHAAAARALIEWLGGVEAQRLAAERAFRLPARTDIPPSELPAWARDVEPGSCPRKWTGTCSSGRAPGGWRPGTGRSAAAAGDVSREHFARSSSTRSFGGSSSRRLLLTASAALALAAVATGRVAPAEIPSLLDWRLLALFFVLTVAVELGKHSDLFDRLVAAVVRRARHARALAFALIGVTGLCAALLTNDVAPCCSWSRSRCFSARSPKWTWRR